MDYCFGKTKKKNERERERAWIHTKKLNNTQEKRIACVPFKYGLEIFTKMEREREGERGEMWSAPGAWVVRARPWNAPSLPDKLEGGEWILERV